MPLRARKELFANFLWIEPLKPWNWLLGGSSRYRKCLVTPIFKPWSSAIWKGSHNPILKGQQRSPWLLTMCKSWDDPPSKYISRWVLSLFFFLVANALPEVSQFHSPLKTFSPGPTKRGLMDWDFGPIIFQGFSRGERLTCAMNKGPLVV